MSKRLYFNPKCLQSKIKKKESCPAPAPAAVYVTLKLPLPPPPSPWILKWVGLESSGRILITLNSNTKIIAKKKKNHICIYFGIKQIGLILKVTKITTEHLKLPKMGINGKISLLGLPEGQKKTLAKGQISPQELEVGPLSVLYLLVFLLNFFVHIALLQKVLLGASRHCRERSLKVR